MSSDAWEVNRATPKLVTRLQWKIRTSGSQTRIVAGDRCASAGSAKPRSVLAGLGIGDLLEGLGVIGGVHFLLVLVDRIDLVAAALELDLANGEAFGLELLLQ